MGSSKDFWNSWNSEHRESYVGETSRRQAEVVLDWMSGGEGLKILDAGCGTGWLCAQLMPFGAVVGTDLADDVIARAQERWPEARFVAGDVMTVDVGADFDVVVTLEVLSHVADRAAFLERIKDWLRPGGRLLLATQNRPVLTRFNRLPPPGPDQIRHWVDRRELRQLLDDAGFVVDEMIVVTPQADHGLMRVVAKLGRMTHTTRLLERLGFGWTIMVSARAPR